MYLSCILYIEKEKKVISLLQTLSILLKITKKESISIKFRYYFSPLDSIYIPKLQKLVHSLIIYKMSFPSYIQKNKRKRNIYNIYRKSHWCPIA